jgi:glycosyltransferase involved in cell wall biosynthesis
MKILFVIPSVTNYFTFLKEITEKLTEMGNKVFLATSLEHLGDIDCYNNLELPEVFDIQFPRGSNFKEHYSSAKKLRNIVSEIKPNLIHTHFSAAAYTVALAKDKDWPKTIATFHGLSFPMLNGWKKMAVGSAEKWAGASMDEVYVLNECDKIDFEKATDHKNVRLLNTFGLGCNLDVFNPENFGKAAKKEIQKSLKLDDRHFNFIFIGRQVHFKGFAKVVRAFLRLHLTKPHTRLILVGTKDKIHKTGLTSSEIKEIENCRGIIQIGWQKDVERYLSIAHVNVFPSDKEGIPVNLMESLSMGVPVITVNSRGCRDVVEHMKSGLVLEKRNDEAIFEAMRYLVENTELVKDFSNYAISVREKFNREHFIENQFKIILDKEYKMKSPSKKVEDLESKTKGQLVSKAV